ncbi:hypothetical protein CPT03_14575 [Pedobacter ginsengisoli]|uniref:Uncharacterized protein n=1 Tax=Pedobacter ginsengisoli TaxID=363852 RepID=A0A2D1U7N9_9SPHI|nr:hypothetical protein [Pedobacter ginsengisoli]ATP57611.1 hypothetical protein CPT03_14575 [Pedobacter ginsengisoli]
MIKEMISDGVIIKGENTLKLNLAMKDTLDKFEAFLEESGEFKRLELKQQFESHGDFEEDALPGD